MAKDIDNEELDFFDDFEEMNQKETFRKDEVPENAAADTEMNTVACLNRIVKALRASNFDTELQEKLRDDFEYVGKMLGTTNLQTAMVGVITEECGGRSRHADVDDLTRALGCSNIEFLAHEKEIRTLEQKRIIKVVHNRMRGDEASYVVNADALLAIQENRQYSPASIAGLTPEGLMEEMRRNLDEYFDETLTTERLADRLREIIYLNPGSKFGQQVMNKHILDLDDAWVDIFMFMCCRYVLYGHPDNDVDRLTQLTGNNSKSNMLDRNLKQGRTPLHREGLVCFSSNEEFMNTDSLSLTDTVKENFFTEYTIEEEKVKDNPDVKLCSSITSKKLFFNDREEEQFNRLAQILKEDNLKGVKARLAEKGMRTGICVLMHGAAGTGKTESCYQLARMTGRDIFAVDVAKLKNKWVGDSEKSVRSAFRYYRQLVSSRELAPILLFNEADAIFGVRKKGAEDSVDKMNNAIQNIILQEMETLDGILIATTNLGETNFDSAFERRFLFKIRFDVPGEKPRTLIWKSMLPELSDEEAANLAHAYAFSGGHIENIARKSTIEYILAGTMPTVSQLTKFCGEETIAEKKQRARIGFD